MNWLLQMRSRLEKDSAVQVPETINSAHPFYPPNLEMTTYVPNERGTLNMFAMTSTMLMLVLSTVWLAVSFYCPRLKVGDKAIIVWFTLCGTIHMFFEGYFIVHHTKMPEAQDLFGQLWKEYALSDSRYMNSDALVLCMETITVTVWGPLSYLTAYLIAVRHPLRHPLQSMVSLAHVYSDSLYYATSLYDLYVNERSHCRPEPFYFWVYFFAMNFIWIVIPLILLYQSTTKTREAFAAFTQINNALKLNENARHVKTKPHTRSGDEQTLP